ncbi:MFS transporter [Arenivirga flava]|uniref:MFS transporter n=1 Tax=Arenivirga flava TaxID=1930060 RepID=A0AA37X8A5_9MICO|nr:MFS transporter [Arenivirga flava]GMA27434.1 MFS transporter [Arenivirga flava]
MTQPETSPNPVVGAAPPHPIPSETTSPAGDGALALLRRDPLLRGLVASTLVGALGRGVFFTLTVLYFTRFVGFDPIAVGAGLTVAGGIGVATALLGGTLADRFGAKPVLVLLTLLQGASLAAYAWAAHYAVFLALAALVVGSTNAGYSARSALVARGFASADQVTARATMRVATNVSIAIGAAIAALALAADTAEAYRLAMSGAGAVYLVSALLVLRLPARDVHAGPASGERTPQRRPWRDRRYLALTVFNGLAVMQFTLFEVGVPVWVAEHTSAPDVLVSLLLLGNTVLVIALQIPLARGTGGVRGASRAALLAGIFMAGACGLYAASSVGAGAVVVVVLLGAAVGHSVAELLFSAGGWSLGFELADQRRAGAYQGMLGVGTALGSMAAPLLITATVLTLGAPGWAVLAAVFLAAGVGMHRISRSALRAGVGRV